MRRNIMFSVFLVVACTGTAVRTIPVENHATEIAAANQFAKDTDRMIQSHANSVDVSSKVSACLEHLHTLAAGLQSCDATTVSLKESISRMDQELEQNREKISSMRADLGVADGTKWKWTIRGSLLSFFAGIASVFAARIGWNLLKVAGKVP